MPLLEFVHYDLKAADPARHRALTGVGNDRILANARALVAAGAPVVFRAPVSPGLNDGDADLVALARLLHDVGRPALHLLAYHALGEGKLARLGQPRRPLGPLGDGAAAVASAARRLAARGIEVTS